MGREINVVIPNTKDVAGIDRQRQHARNRSSSLAPSRALRRTLQLSSCRTTTTSQFSSLSDHNENSFTTDELPTSLLCGSSISLPQRSSVHVQASRDAETAESVHNFRNILNTVSLLSELALSKLPNTSPVCETIRHIMAACVDANELCNQMMEKDRSASDCRENVNLSCLVREIAPLLSTYLPTGSELQFELRDSLPPVSASASEVRQVITNLVKNAAEALGECAGKVRVSTGTTELAHEDRGESPYPGTPGKSQYSYIEVSDTGCGMDETTKARLFESAFTTKSDGHGLGTASIGRIVRRCDGIIQVQSKVGDGTRIRVLFPLVHT